VGTTVIEVASLSKSFGKRGEQEVIQRLDLTVDRGEFVTVVGASGCGKSTLLNIIAGLDKPTLGNVIVTGKVALMFQDATLLPWLSAIQNIQLALRLQGVQEPTRTTRAQELLNIVRLGDAMHKRPHELSGGMKQRVALARCLAQDASIVLMDEPLGALDAMTRDHLHDEIEALSRDQGLTVVFVTHNMREAIRLGDRVILMGSKPGRVVHEERVDLPRPRLMDSVDIATRAARLTMHLKNQQVDRLLSGADS
jgi:NitT/TauT family transport system ATP-binding protein